MVSPFRIAREAAELKAEKFLDELLVWRELAFNFCLHQYDHVDSLDAVPDWAKRTLVEHEADVRDEDHSWESLARAQTDHRLWDACQRSLLKHGELHNNVRMTWGKAFLGWTSSPSRALYLATDLNHRYALDGRDPSSYDKLLWCFGQFDRPFEPEAPLFGTVRPRSVDEHEKRIDMTKYLRVVDRSICENQPAIAIIGSGMAGLIAARTLADHGLSVKVFDKSRGVGGRMATRRTEDGLSFDHGAQYFTARDDRFSRQVQSWIHDEVVQPWHGRIVQLRQGTVVGDKGSVARYVGVPGMNSIARRIASDLDVTLGCTVQEIRMVGSEPTSRWLLMNDAGDDLGQFDIVIANCPPNQSAPLLRPHTPIATEIAQIEMLPCWASMIEIDEKAVLPFDAAFVDANPLSWISRNDTKPHRPKSSAQCWVLHASSDWSSLHLEADATEVEVLMHQAFLAATNLSALKIVPRGTHRWRYAIPKSVLSQPCLWDPMTKLGACGDWCGGPRVEGAFLSGAAMAGAILRDHTIDRKAVADEQHQELLF
jgi:predicted NAD/FAD-dependent oxidoreductase